MNTSFNCGNFMQIDTDNGLTWLGQTYHPIATFITSDAYDLFEDGDEVDLTEFVELVFDEDDCSYVFLTWDEDMEDWGRLFTVTQEIYETLTSIGDPCFFHESVEAQEDSPRW